MDVRQEFDKLQRRLTELWKRLQADSTHPYTVLALPSISLDYAGISTSVNLSYYEERIFYLFNLLRSPNIRLVMVTSHQIAPALVDYHLHLLPGLPFTHARQRVKLFATYDFSRKPLAAKLLARPALMKRIQQAIVTEDGYINCYTTSDFEREVAVQLGLPLMGPHPDFQEFGSKSCSRRLFRDLNIALPEGFEDVSDEDQLVEAVGRLTELGWDQAVIKQNYTFSGMGNAVLPLVAGQKPDQIRARLASDTRLPGPDVTWESFVSRLYRYGGVVEGLVPGTPCSVQVRLSPLGEVEIVSTHDELMGGKDEQSYIGCRFPAYPDGLPQLHAYGEKVGEHLAKRGVVGRIEIGCQVVEAEDGPDLVALDLNLRKGNTALPLRTLQLLTGGTYDKGTGVYIARMGEPRYYISSDKLGGGRLKGMLPEDLVDIATATGIHYSSSDHVGVVFHMLGGLSELGVVGATCIHRTPREAEGLYRRTREVLEREFLNYWWMV